jgi:hypothetical protein
VINLIFWKIVINFSIILILFSLLRRGRNTESDLLQRIQYSLKNTHGADIPLIYYTLKSLTSSSVSENPLVIFISSYSQSHLILDKYAVGLCLANFPTCLITLNSSNNSCGDYEFICRQILSHFQLRSTQIISIFYQKSSTMGLDLFYNCHQQSHFYWFFISPELTDITQLEKIMTENSQISLVFALDDKTSYVKSLISFQSRFKNAKRHFLTVPNGGHNLKHQEQVILGMLTRYFYEIQLNCSK